jgi:SAM-dependent methyltransferase
MPTTAGKDFTMMPMAGVPYALNNDTSTAASMLDSLSAILDPVTRRRLAELELSPTGRYWEVAAGNGSVATWLFRTLGPTATVTATDLNVRHMPYLDGLRVLARDDAVEAPLPGPWDGIHARLALAHWPNRRMVLAAYAQVLRPGGWLLVEDWGPWPGMLLSSPVPEAAGIYGRYQEALRRVFDARGNEATWAGDTAGVMVGAGLERVSTTVSADTWRGGSPGCLLPVTVAAELREQLVAHGADAGELDALPTIMNDPETLVLGNSTWSTVGFAPTSA